MSPAEARDLALVGLVLFAPTALVVIVALLRGYSLNLTMRRRHHEDDDED